MALAVDGAFVFYFCLLGAMLPTCLLDSVVDITYKHFTSDFPNNASLRYTGAFCF